MADATAIVNARLMAPVSNNPEAPCVLSPANLLTHIAVDPNEDLNICVNEVYYIQWKFVQFLERLVSLEKWVSVESKSAPKMEKCSR